MHPRPQSHSSCCFLRSPYAAEVVALSCCHIQHILISRQQEHCVVILAAKQGSMPMASAMPGDRCIPEAPDMHRCPGIASCVHLLPTAASGLSQGMLNIMHIPGQGGMIGGHMLKTGI